MPCEVAAVCLSLFGSLFSSLLWCRLDTTCLFWADESASKRHQVWASQYFCSWSAMAGTRARIRREPCKVGHSFDVAHLSPNIELTSHPVPSHKWNCQQIVEQTLKVLRIQERRCSSRVMWRTLPTQTGQYPRSPMSIRPTCCRLQEQVKLAMDPGGGWEKSGQAKMTPAKVALHNMKKTPWRLQQAKRGSLSYGTAGALEWTSKWIFSLFFFFAVFLCTSFIFQTRLFTAKEVCLLKLYDSVVGLQTWRGYADYHVSVGTDLTDSTMMYARGKGLFVFPALAL